MHSQSASEFLSSLRLAYPLVVCDAYCFALHVYQIALDRDPEFNADTIDISILRVKDAWDRCSYIKSTFQSQEFATKNADYSQMLDAFFAVLGYNGSRKTLIRYMEGVYPTAEDFSDNIEDIFAVISINTQRMYFGPPIEQIVADVDAPEIARVAISNIPALNERCARIEADLRDLIWNVSDLRSRLSNPAVAQPAHQDMIELLLAIQAQLQMGVIK